MTPDELTCDRLGCVLRTLPRQEPRPETAGRLRLPCHQGLAKRVGPHRVLTPAHTSRGRLVADTVPACAFGLLYLADVVRRALSMFGL